MIVEKQTSFVTLRCRVVCTCASQRLIWNDSRTVTWQIHDDHDIKAKKL